MTAIDVIKTLNEKCCGLFSSERPSEKASNGEIRRWFQNKAVHINGGAVAWDTQIDQVHSVVLFPSGKRRTTLL